MTRVAGPGPLSVRAKQLLSEDLRKFESALRQAASTCPAGGALPVVIDEMLSDLHERLLSDADSMGRLAGTLEET